MIEGVDYEVAQNLIIYPKNVDSKVFEVCDYLKVSPDDKITEFDAEKLPFPLPITYFEAISQYCDFQGVLKYFIYILEKSPLRTLQH